MNGVMMEKVIEKDFLTIKEAADELGISVQAVYQRLEKDLKPYLKVLNGKKRLDIRALELFNKEDVSSDLTSDFKAVLNLLERQLEEKDRQIAAKDNQIEQLQAQLAEERLHSRTEIEQLTQTVQASQALHAADKQQLLLMQQSDAEAPRHWWQRKKDKFF